MQLTYPPTVVVRHPKERPERCSILPLKGREDMIFLTFPSKKVPSLDGYVRLSADGPALNAADADCGILLLDACWRRADQMIQEFADVPPRSLNEFLTAYPRVSKLGTDPDNGLASVEALYLAYHILGRPTLGLLDHYRWGDEFLVLNKLN